jgi:CubicO group peptidase (beta-lactamase class C family)
MFYVNRINDLKDYMENCCSQGVFPGAAYALVTKSKVYVNSVGKRQVVPEEKHIENDTIFDLASLTKPVSTTTCILILIEKGLLTLNTKVISILPEYKYEDITIKQLITHTAGYPPEPTFRLDMNYDEMKQSIFDAVPDNEIKDNKVIYSDVGFLLLGLIIEKLSGSYSEFAKKNIFDVLDMKDTGFNPNEKILDRCAATELCKLRKEILIGQVHDEKSFLLNGVAGHAGLFSTAYDLAKFAQMILNDGLYKDNAILSKNSIDLIFQSQTEHLNSNRSVGWAMWEEGSTMGDLVSKNAIYHTGFTGGSILIDKHYGKAFILLTNRVHPSRDNIELISYRAKINNIAMAAMM